MAQAYRLVVLLREGGGAREAAEGLGSTQEPGGGADSPLGGAQIQDKGLEPWPPGVGGTKAGGWVCLC